MTKPTGRSIAQFAILGVSLLFVILSLTLTELPGGSSRESPLEISVLIHDSDATLWSGFRLGAEEAARSYGSDLRFIIPAAPSGHDKQEALAQKELQQGADALIVSSLAPDRLAAALEQEEGNTPVFYIDSSPAGGGVTLSPDNYALGTALAATLVEDRAGGKIFLLNSAGEREGIRQRQLGCEDTLKQAGVSYSLLRTESLAQALADGAGVLICLEQTTTLLAARQLEEYGSQAAIYGTGSVAELAAYLEMGTITALAAWSEYAAGYLAVQCAVEAVDGTARQPDFLQFTVIREGTMYEPDNQKLLFPFSS